jgi:hypothetical protein
MRKADKLNIPFQVKSNLATYKEVDSSSREITAVVNTYNYFDSDFDVLRKGCALRSINNRGASSQANDKILHALFHDLTKLPGKSIYESEENVTINYDGSSKSVLALVAKSKLSEASDGEETLIKYNEGIYNQHSIGFQYKDIEYIEEGSESWENFLRDLINPEDAERVGFGWDVKEINWFEWSTVSFGANRLTPFLSGKSSNKNIQLQNLQTKLGALIEAAKSGIKNKHIFEKQYLQIQQMISELAYSPESAKCTPKESHLAEAQKKAFRRSILTQIY